MNAKPNLLKRTWHEIKSAIWAVRVWWILKQIHRIEARRSTKG